MYSRVLTCSIYGLDGDLTWAEVDTDNGLPSFCIVGLPNQSVKEARERIHAAISNCGFSFPVSRITVNLTPANRKKDGSHYDLAIALAVLASSSKNAYKSDPETAYLGELTLDGKVNAIDGALPMVMSLKSRGVKKIVIPKSNLEECMLVNDVLLYPVSDLKQACTVMSGKPCMQGIITDGEIDSQISPCPDFADIKGQAAVKRAAQVAACGMHGMLMVGPPGVGKSMVGKRISGILPGLSYSEMLDVTRIYSVAGELHSDRKLITQRPFRAPHHSISAAALIGGGSIPRPGEISLAHKGILFLDELPEFSSNTLEMLRQPLEDKEVAVNRASGKCIYPSDFMLVAAMNPCRCGYFGDPVKPCQCTESSRKKYIGKISGPLLDRIDIHVGLERMIYKDIESSGPGICTAELRKGVETALGMQNDRYKDDRIKYNSQLTPDLISRYCMLNPKCKSLMENAFEHMSLSARAYHRILKVARSIADMRASDNISEEDLLEALSYRIPERFFR